MSSRGYDINMLQLDLVGNIIALGANLGYNFIPRLFYPWEFFIFAVLAPALVVFLVIVLIKAVKEKGLMSRFTLFYLILHLPFFLFFLAKV